MCSYYYMAMKSRSAYEEYLRTGNPDAYVTYVRYYDAEDMDLIPRLAEVDDANPRTSQFRTDYVSEMYVVGNERMRLYPFT